MNGADKFDVCDILQSIGRDVGFGDKFNGVGAFYPSAYTLCKTSKFIGSVSVPGILEFGVMEELSVFEVLDSLHVNDSVCTVTLSGKDACGNAVIGWVLMCAPVLCNMVSNAVIIHSGSNVGVI